eukprot:scaffold15973_cov137-Isochrysis_galbana.AAC.2
MVEAEGAVVAGVAQGPWVLRARAGVILAWAYPPAAAAVISPPPGVVEDRLGNVVVHNWIGGEEKRTLRP